jgi:hypothetical protein
MFEVVDSPTESSKCADKQIKEGDRISCSKQENWTVRFHQFLQQSGALPTLMRKPFLQPSDIWMRRGKNHDKPKGLWRRLQDLIEEKNKNRENRVKTRV